MADVPREDKGALTALGLDFPPEEAGRAVPSALARGSCCLLGRGHGGLSGTFLEEHTQLEHGRSGRRCSSCPGLSTSVCAGARVTGDTGDTQGRVALWGGAVLALQGAQQCRGPGAPLSVRPNVQSCPMLAGPVGLPQPTRHAVRCLTVVPRGRSPRCGGLAAAAPGAPTGDTDGAFCSPQCWRTAMSEVKAPQGHAPSRGSRRPSACARIAPIPACLRAPSAVCLSPVSCVS